MKRYTLLLSFFMLCFTCYTQEPSAFDARYSTEWIKDAALNAERSARNARYDTLFKDLKRTFSLSRAEIRNKLIVDSIFGTAENYLVEAIKGNYNRIVILITSKNLFAKSRVKSFYVDKMIKEVMKRNSRKR